MYRKKIHHFQTIFGSPKKLWKMLRKENREEKQKKKVKENKKWI